MKTIVLVSGKLQSGKNLFTDLCMNELKDFAKVSYDYFAKELKNRCKEDFRPLVNFVNSLCERLPEDVVESIYTKDENWFENKNELTRILLQLYGTEIFRNRVDQNYWAKQVVESVKNSDSDVIFITDVRFPSEIDAINTLENDYGFNIITIRINRTLTREQEFNQHESETALDNYRYFDEVIENNGTMEELTEKARKFSKMIQNEI